MPQTVVSLNHLQTKLMRSFGAMLLVLLILLGFAIWSFHRLSDANEWKVHTYKVLLESQGLEESFFVIDNSVRGFIVTGTPQNLAELEKGKADFRDHLGTLRKLVSNNPPQETRLQQVFKQKEHYMEIVAPILTSRLPSYTAEQAIIKSSPSVTARRAALATIRKTLGTFEDRERVLLEERTRTYNQWQFWSEVTLCVGSARLKWAPHRAPMRSA